MFSRVQARFCGTMSFAVFTMYPGLCASVFSFFSCAKIEGQHYLAADYKVACFTGQWSAYLPLALAGLLLYVMGLFRSRCPACASGIPPTDGVPLAPLRNRSASRMQASLSR